MAYEFNGDIEVGRDPLPGLAASPSQVGSEAGAGGLQWGRPSEILQLKENEYVYRENENPKGLYFLKSGCVKAVVNRSMTRGRMVSPEFVLKLVAPGEIFGFKPLIQGNTYRHFVKTVKASEIYVYPKEVVTSIMNGGNQMLKTLLTQAARDLDEQQNVAQLHYLASVQERIAYQLVLLADKFGTPTANGVDINLRLTRNELAQLAGTINESLSRHLTELKTDGIVELHGKEITIKNIEELRKRSGNFR
jgi:CRP-like cAMP-binding protein